MSKAKVKKPTAEDLVKLKSMYDGFLFRHAEASTSSRLVDERGYCLGICDERDKMC
jgi:hypothetical protein